MARVGSNGVAQFGGDRNISRAQIAVSDDKPLSINKLHKVVDNLKENAPPAVFRLADEFGFNGNDEIKNLQPKANDVWQGINNVKEPSK